MEELAGYEADRSRIRERRKAAQQHQKRRFVKMSHGKKWGAIWCSPGDLHKGAFPLDFAGRAAA